MLPQKHASRFVNPYSIYAFVNNPWPSRFTESLHLQALLQIAVAIDVELKCMRRTSIRCLLRRALASIDYEPRKIMRSMKNLNALLVSLFLATMLTGSCKVSTYEISEGSNKTSAA